MAKTNKTYVGTELKMHIGFSYPSDPTVTLDSLNSITVEFYCNRGAIQTFQKSDLVEQNGEYYACVDTSITGSGQLKMKMTVQIPDNDFPDNYRTEVGICNTNVVIE